MTNELKALVEDLDSTFFRYAHITGAIDLFMIVLENPRLQRALSKDKKSGVMGISTSSKTGKYWEILNMEAPGLLSLRIDRREQQIHRSMWVDGEEVTWYPKLSVKKVLDEWRNLLGFVYGIIISRMIGDLDFYLCSVLQNHFGHAEVSGSSWEPFIMRTRIDLLRREHGEFIYTLFQERHKIEHSKARVDERFIQRMFKKAIRHAYKIGDPIQKNHLDVFATYQAIREFAGDVDGELSKLIKMQNGA